MALLLEELQERGFKRAGVMLLHYDSAMDYRLCCHPAG